MDLQKDGEYTIKAKFEQRGGFQERFDLKSNLVLKSEKESSET